MSFSSSTCAAETLQSSPCSTLIPICCRNCLSNCGRRSWSQRALDASEASTDLGRHEEFARHPNGGVSSLADTRQFLVRCPHCHSPAPVPADQSLTRLSCPTCGSDFRIVDEPDEDSDPVPHRLGHFDLLFRIGVGGFGVVWKGIDTQSGRPVAIKVPRHGHLDPGEQAQFLREARSAAQLQHPHIVPVYEVGREGETLYIVSELIEGASLAECLAARRFSARKRRTFVGRSPWRSTMPTRPE